ncbi:MAG: 6-phosphogluconolactonase [Spirochaetaceae bacterium]
MLIHSEKIEKLEARVYNNRKSMGEAVAAAVIETIESLLKERESIHMLFAAAPSQQELLDGLRSTDRIPWDRIRAFHMDEYTGLDSSAPQRFGNFLDRALFEHVPLKRVFYIDGSADDVEGECRRYSRLLEEYPLDIALHGIGENGHIAFNDPPVADFNDPLKVKVVSLDGVCRQQQVNDGCFSSMEDVPTEAITITVPELIRPKHIFCTVPGARKAPAVQAALFGEISEATPASILRTTETWLFLDRESGESLLS